MSTIGAADIALKDSGDASKAVYKTLDTLPDGAFKRALSKFRESISSELGSRFPPEKGRYVLYINYGCPWASRTNLVRTLKGLEDIIEMVVLDWELFPGGWAFTGRDGTAEKDPLYGFKKLSELYFKAEPRYEGRYTVPVLWDKKEETIVSNESSEIIRMFYDQFDALLPEDRREGTKGDQGYLPAGGPLREKIEELNQWVYDDVNNGVYKAGFATTQEAYEAAVVQLFESLDRVEKILEESDGPYLLGKHITDADIRLFPTIARFDVAYHTLFMCNLKLIRHDYPHIQKWLVGLYWDKSEVTRGAFGASTHFDAIKKGYAHTPRRQFVPLGPLGNIAPADG